MYKVVKDGEEVGNSKSFADAWDYAGVVKTQNLNSVIIVEGPEGKWVVKS